MKPDIDLKVIEEQLRAYISPEPTKDKPKPKCPVRFSVRKHNGYQLSSLITDDRIDFYINPKLIRTQAQLDRVIYDCQRELAWGQ